MMKANGWAGGLCQLGATCNYNRMEVAFGKGLCFAKLCVMLVRDGRTWKVKNKYRWFLVYWPKWGNERNSTLLDWKDCGMNNGINNEWARQYLDLWLVLQHLIDLVTFILSKHFLFDYPWYINWFFWCKYYPYHIHCNLVWKFKQKAFKGNF